MGWEDTLKQAALLERPQSQSGLGAGQYEDPRFTASELAKDIIQNPTPFITEVSKVVKDEKVLNKLKQIIETGNKDLIARALLSDEIQFVLFRGM